MPGTSPTISVILPAFNAAEFLSASLEGLKAAGFDMANEVCVVDDGSRDKTTQIALGFGVDLVSNAKTKGAAGARANGAQRQGADILLFVDADVIVAPDTKARLVQAFADPRTAAVFGTYDAVPAAPGLISQYRNLLHRYVHLTSAGAAQTFWTGLGAVRRSAYEEVGGIDPAQRMMEDVEFGMRLSAGGHHIVLDPKITGTHLKRWTTAKMIKTDLFDRAIPWSRLLMRQPERFDGLNLSFARKGAAVAAAGVGVGLVSLLWGQGGAGVLILSLLGFIGLSWGFIRWIAELRGVAFAAGVVMPHLVHNWCALAGYAWVRLDRLRGFRGQSNATAVRSVR